MELLPSLQTFLITGKRRLSASIVPDCDSSKHRFSKISLCIRSVMKMIAALRLVQGRKLCLCVGVTLLYCTYFCISENVVLPGFEDSRTSTPRRYIVNGNAFQIEQIHNDASISLNRSLISPSNPICSNKRKVSSCEENFNETYESLRRRWELYSRYSRYLPSQVSAH